MQGRKAEVGEKIKKDQDFDSSAIILGPKKKELLVKQIEADVDFLESCGVMDYSLLFGICSNKKERKLIHSVSRAVITKDDLKLKPIKANHNLPTISKKEPISIFCKEGGGLFSSNDDDNNNENIIYFLGIIDVLQEYTLTKKN